MRRLGFKIRLVGVYVALAGTVLALTVAGTHHLLSRAVLGQLIDDALVALAEAEAAELAAAPDEPVRVHELGPGVARLSVERLNKFVQVVELDGQVVARSVTLGRTQLPVSPETLRRLRQKEVVLETDEHFGRYRCGSSPCPSRSGAGPTPFRWRCSCTTGTSSCARRNVSTSARP